VDLLPHLDGREPGTPHDRLLWRRTAAAAVREGNWKLIRVEEEDGSFRAPILVDLARDPGELVDRAGEEPERVRSLLELLEAWETELVPPRWLTGEVWRRNQRRKHEPGVIGREAERELP
jgi:arylsulfatase A-like enzyme